jgi:hypothetical protein
MPNSSVESSSMGSAADTTVKTKESVRIDKTKTVPVWARPTRASLLRQRALAELSTKKTVPAVRTGPTRASLLRQRAISELSTKNPAKLRTETNTTTRSANSFNPRNGRYFSSHFRSVSPPRYGDVRRTRASMLRQLKNDYEGNKHIAYIFHTN